MLEPIERISEVLFGLIMVLTFTGSLSVAESGRDDVKAMLIGALGCNLAWGVIDAILYLMAALAEHGQRLSLFRAVRTADADAARRLIAGALPPIMAGVMQPSELDAIRERLAVIAEPPRAGRLQGADFFGALGVFLLVFLSTLPVAVPFMVMTSAQAAMRASNAVAIVMLLFTGWAFGRVSGRHPLPFAVGMVILGLALVGLTIALGG